MSHNTLMRLEALLERMRRHNPWDARQTHKSLLPYLHEETAELADAICTDDQSPDATQALKSELGDVLLQVLMHATLAKEDGRFELADVLATLEDKLHRRLEPLIKALDTGASPPNEAQMATHWQKMKDKT